MGAFVISPLPPICWSSCTTAGPLRSTGITRFFATTGPSATLSSSTDFPVLPVIRLSVPWISPPGRGGLLQLLNVSLSSCRRYRPARAYRRIGQFVQRSILPSPPQCGFGLWVLGFRGHLCVHFRYSPMTCSPSQGWLCQSTPCTSFPPRMRFKLQGSDFYPGGPFPPEHISLLLDMH